jgi:hypothetical protein
MNILVALALVILLAWFVLSQVIADLICRGERDQEIVRTVHAGCFMAPAIFMMIVLAYAIWHLERFANDVGMPGIGPASDNPMDYL